MIYRAGYIFSIQWRLRTMDNNFWFSLISQKLDNLQMCIIYCQKRLFVALLVVFVLHKNPCRNSGQLAK